MKMNTKTEYYGAGRENPLMGGGLTQVVWGAYFNI